MCVMHFMFNQSGQSSSIERKVVCGAKVHSLNANGVSFLLMVGRLDWERQETGNAEPTERDNFTSCGVCSMCIQLRVF